MSSFEQLIEGIIQLNSEGWTRSTRAGDGGVGGTLEDCLGIAENNFQGPDSGEWELKARRSGSSALLTLFHMEPDSLSSSPVPHLLSAYGWPHQEADQKYPLGEKSFRQTLGSSNHTDRGFIVRVDRVRQEVQVDFDIEMVQARHDGWRQSVLERGADFKGFELHFPFLRLEQKLLNKLNNCILVVADSRKVEGVEYFHYIEVDVLRGVNFQGFIDAIESGIVKIDFDARTGHNHGTKFRLPARELPLLYAEVEKIAV